MFRGVEAAIFFAPPSTLSLPESYASVEVQDVLRSKALARYTFFFDRKSVTVLLDGLPTMDQNAPPRTSLDPLLFMVTSMCILQQRYALGVDA